MSTYLFPEAAIQAQRKRLVICCDGTWQSAVTGNDTTPSNIARLARQIAKAGRDSTDPTKIWQQVVFYVAGVGTGALSKIEVARQGGTGDGLVINVINAYNFIVNNYNPGDQIFCFGFSRGAFTARAVAGLVNDIGVIRPSHMHLFPSLFAVYKSSNSKQDFLRSKEYFLWQHAITYTNPQRKMDPIQDMRGITFGDDSRYVELVGVFDTAKSLGLADTYLFNNAWSREQFEWINVRLSPYIKHAFHALSLDERREPFIPPLFYIPNKTALQANKMSWAEDKEWLKELDDDGRKQVKDWVKEVAKRDEQQLATWKPDLIQVWFTGVHINVGGGFDEDDVWDFEGLSNITYAWMVQQCRKYIAFEENLFDMEIGGNYQLEVDTVWRRRQEKEEHESFFDHAKDHFHDVIDHGKKLLGMQTSSSQWAKKPEIFAEGWAMSEIHDSYNMVYKLISAPVTRTPGECHEVSTVSQRALNDLSMTNEYIHPSVYWRTTKSKNHPNEKFRYKSKALADFTRKQDKYSQWGYEKGSVWIPEWIIRTHEGLDNHDQAELLVSGLCKDWEEVMNFCIDMTKVSDDAARKRAEAEKGSKR